MHASSTKFTAMLPIVLLRTLLLIAILSSNLSWSATTLHAAAPNHPEVDCDESCKVPAALEPRLFLPILNRAPQPTSSHTIVEPQPLWTADWWQWVERTTNGPVLADGDVDCSWGQDGSLWFLAGASDNLPKTRNCTIPSGKTLLAPLFTIVFYNAPGENYTLEEKEKELDAFYSDEVPGMLNTELCHLESSIDGTPVNSVRLLSPPFAAQGDPEALADGFYFAFQLSPGVHQVQFSGVLCQFGTDIEAYVVDVTYNLTVSE